MPRPNPKDNVVPVCLAVFDVGLDKEVVLGLVAYSCGRETKAGNSTWTDQWEKLSLKRPVLLIFIQFTEQVSYLLI